MTAKPNDLLDDDQLAEVLENRQLLNAADKSDLTVREFCAQYGVSRARLYRLRKKAKNGASYLTNLRKFNCGRPSRIDDRTLAWALAYIATFPGAPMTEVCKEVAKIAAEQNWPKTNYWMLKRAIDGLDQDMRLTLRESAQEVFNKTALVMRHRYGFANQLWQADATELDARFVDMETGEVFRPWLTACIDAYTRATWLVLHRTKPNAAGVLELFRSAMMPKGNGHVLWGMPATIQTDNESIWRAGDVCQTMVDLGVDYISTDVEMPVQDGLVERVFGTVKTKLLSKLCTYTDKHAALADAERYAIPWPLADSIVKKFLAEYHLTVHRGLKTTPYEQWMEGLEDARGLVFSRSEVESQFRVSREFIVNSDGIELEAGRHFTSPNLMGLVGETVVVRIPIAGRVEEVLCYFKGNLVDTLICSEENPELSTLIASKRTKRSIELSPLRRVLARRA